LIKKIMPLIVLFVFAVPAPAQAQAKSCPKWEPLLRKYGLPVKEMSFILWRESKCEPKAIGWNYHKGKSHRDCQLAPAGIYKNCKAVRSYDIGLSQVNSTWNRVVAKVCKRPRNQLIRSLQDPTCNVKVAGYLYRNGGLAHWRGTSGK
jgi:hypothetical protein